MSVQPLFADYLLVANPNSPKFWVPQSRKFDFRGIQARIRRAERLVFDAEASARVGKVLHEIPELLIEQIQFARSPFDLCWIEYQADVVWREVVGHAPDHTDLDRDVVVGLLIDHNRINVFSRSFNGNIGMMPYVFHLNTEWHLEDQLHFSSAAGVSRLGIDLWLWGSTAEVLVQRGQRDRLRILRDTTMTEIIDDRPEVMRGIFHPEDSGSNGDFKNIVALLLMLNQQRITQYFHVPTRRGWIGNKPKPFLSHHNVKVSLDAHAQLLAHSLNGDSDLRRRHRVRGHYCHDQTARDYARIAGCVHDWEPMDNDWEPAPDLAIDEREHWKCRVCDGKRWWRIAHERGDESKGFVEHQYQVTA